MKIWILVGCATLLFGAHSQVFAQACPSGSAPLKQVQDAISNLQKNGRAPSGADCAFNWASNYTFSGSLAQKDIDFFKIASEVHRQAYAKRRGEAMDAEADAFLDREITIHKKFLDEAFRQDSTSMLRPAVVRHLSNVIGAMALRNQYLHAAEYLGNRKDATVIDDEAVHVWVQALWSCAKWDGNKQNICHPATRELCRAKIETFLDSVSNMKGRAFAPATKLDIEHLRQLRSGSCLK